MLTESKAPFIAAPKGGLSEVKYSLPELLAEIEAEKGGSVSFAMEKLDQAEIGKLFKPKKLIRVKPQS
jgi:hypothetical protein